MRKFRLLIAIAIFVVVNKVSSAAEQAISPWIGMPEVGINLGIVGMVLFLWRQDKTDRNRELEKQEARYQDLASNFKSIVQDNTKAITRLVSSLNRRTFECPMARDNPEQLDV